MALIEGNNNANNLGGTQSADTIYGYGGDDVIRGLGGNDIIYGGSGNDDIYGGLGENDLYGGSGADWFVMTPRSSGLSDDLIADFEFDTDRIDVSGWGVSDFSQLQELLRNDGSGNAYFNAYYNGYNHFVTVDGVAANQLTSADFVYSSVGASRIVGTSYADTLFGSRGGDSINSGAGNDYVLGGLGNDSITGASGNDKIVGGAGADTLSGGSGSDTFIFNSTSESAGSVRDRILDFEEDIDRFDLAGIDANVLVSGNQAFDFIGEAAFTAAGQIRYLFANGNTYIRGNTDGDSAGEFEFLIRGYHDMLSSDFIL